MGNFRNTGIGVLALALAGWHQRERIHVDHVDLRAAAQPTTRDQVGGRGQVVQVVLGTPLEASASVPRVDASSRCSTSEVYRAMYASGR